jgi:hypothetical protein
MKAIIALTVLLTASIATAAEAQGRYTVTVDGQAWDISMVRGTYEQHKELLSQQPWFGHETLALDFLIETCKGSAVE